MFSGFLSNIIGSNYRFSSRSSIEKLLDDDCTLEMFLNDGDVIQECKFGNSKVIDYLDRSKVATLLDFIIEMPPEDASHERGHKFPFVASEIFSCEISAVMDMFFSSRSESEIGKGEPAKYGDDAPDEEEEEEDGEKEVISFDDLGGFTAPTEIKARKSRQRYADEENEEEEEEDDIFANE